MRKYSFIAIVIILPFLLIGCNDESERIELGTTSDTLKPLIDKTRLVELLVDIHLCDAYLSNVKQVGVEIKNKNDYQRFYKGVYAYIFRKYNVPQPKFYRTLQYYSFHQDEFLDIYDEVIDRLRKKEDAVMSKGMKQK